MRLLTLVSGLLLTASSLAAQGPEQEVRAAVGRYNRAMLEKDLPALKAMLASDIVLYEHSVRNIGVDDVWENHLKPEVAGFENASGEFSDVRVWTDGNTAIVTRQYAIRGTLDGKPLDARGNETMGWVRRDGRWQVVHIHYSHPCPRRT